MGFEKLLLLLLTVDSAEELLYLNLTRKLHDTVYHGFGTWRTSGHIYIDGDDFFYSLHHMVRVLKRTARYGTTAASNNILGLGELIIKTAYNRDRKSVV